MKTRTNNAAAKKNVSHSKQSTQDARKIRKDTKRIKNKSGELLVNIGGQPPKLTPMFLEKLEKLVNEWDPLKKKKNPQEALIDYLRLSTVSCLCYEAGIVRSTYYNYAKKNAVSKYGYDLINRFLDTIKRWETKRNALHQRMLPFYATFQTVWIFQAKNFGELRDEVDINLNDQTTPSSDELDMTWEEAREIINEIRRGIVAKKEDDD